MTQHLEALKCANAIRREGATVRRSIESGELDPAAVVRTCTHPIPVKRLLMSVRWVGEKRAREMMRAAGIESDRTFAPTRYTRGITPSQRMALVELLTAKKKNAA